MRIAYNDTGLHHLRVMKEAKQWKRQNLISGDQYTAIEKAYPSPFYHPNIIIRILLFIAAWIALSGVTGFLALMVRDMSEEVLSVVAILFGMCSLLVAEKILIKGEHHYKSGVTETLIYSAAGCIISGVAFLTDFNIHVVLLFSLLVLCFAAIRYADLVTTTLALCTFAGLLFYELYLVGGIFRQIIPVAFILVFTPLYFYFRKLKQNQRFWIWDAIIVLSESFCLLMIYAAGNYLVVRELSVNLMDLDLEPGQEIPLAFLLYALTVLIPLVYLYAGIKKKDIVLLRVSLLVLAFSVFTFKYYYSTGHHEITFTLSGIALLLISIGLLNYLKIIQNGFTRENLLTEKWANMNVEAFLISQTMGGNKVVTGESFKGGGGSFGGGGASGEY